MLLTEFVMVKWHGSNRKWYESRGYIFTKLGDKFEVKIEDLSKGCHIPVLVKCDDKDCKSPFLKPMPWQRYLNNIRENSDYYCVKCANKVKLSTRLSYKEVRDYVEGLNGNGCKLVSKNYDGSAHRLIYTCKCGNDFTATLCNFKSGQKQCKICGIKIRSKKSEFSYKHIREIIKQCGCKLTATEKDFEKERSRQNTNPSSTKLNIKCACGNIFNTDFSQFTLQNKKQCNECSGTKRYEIDEVRNIFKSHGLILDISEEYLNVKTEMRAVDLEGYKVIACLDRVSNGQPPRRFHIMNPYTLYNMQLWLNNNKPGYIILTKEYTHNQDKLLVKCKNGHIFNPTWNDLKKHTYICPHCSGVAQLTTDIYIERIYNMYKDEYTVLGEYKNTMTHILTRHNVCGHEWGVTPNSLMREGCCPKCSQSKGEKRIDNYLINNYWVKIENTEFDSLPNKCLNKYYISQKSFKGLVGMGNGLLSYDFYLPKINILIEFQGEMHERFVKGIHKSIKDFEKQQEHDKRKKQYCLDNNIQLLEIWYWDIDKIEEILDEYIKLNPIPLSTVV